MSKTIGGPTVRLSDVCFVHWPVARAAVANLVPDWCTVDETDGDAWVSVVAMRLADWTAMGVDLGRPAEAVNVRTYVRTPTDDRAVYFLSLDVTDALAAATARGLFRLPYHRASIEREAVDGETRIEAARRKSDAREAGVREAQFVATFAPTGDPSRAGPDTLASFLTERYRYVIDGPLGTRLVGSVGHDAWRLQPADVQVESATVLRAAGVDEPRGDPIAHSSPGARFRVGPPIPTVG